MDYYRLFSWLTSVQVLEMGNSSSHARVINDHGLRSWNLIIHACMPVLDNSHDRSDLHWTTGFLQGPDTYPEKLFLGNVFFAIFNEALSPRESMGCWALARLSRCVCCAYPCRVSDYANETTNQRFFLRWSTRHTSQGCSRINSHRRLRTLFKMRSAFL